MGLCRDLRSVDGRTATIAMTTFTEEKQEYNPFYPVPLSVFQGGTAFLIVALLLASVFLRGRDTKGNVIGSARWGDKRDRETARKMGQAQLKSKDHSKVSLWINAPESIDGTSVSGDKNTIWLPNATSGTSIIGASNTGKSFGGVKPTLRSAIAQGMTTILLDTDYPGLAKTIAPLAESVGYEVDIFAPGFPESRICNVIDFVSDCRDSTGASQLSKTLVKNFSMEGSRGEDIFFSKAGELATEATLLLAKALPHKDLLTAFTVLKDDAMLKRVRNVGKIDPWLSIAFGQLLSTSRSEKTVDSIRGTAALIFGQLMRQDILPSLIGESTIPINNLTGKKLLIFGVKQDIRLVVSPLIAAVINALISKNVLHGRKEPLFLSLDELPSMFFPELPEWLAEKRKYGLCCQLGYQDFGQLKKTYGQELADVIFTNTATKLFFNPQHITTAELISRTLGDRDITYKTQTRTYGKNSSSSRGEHRVKRRLLSADEVLKMAQGSCILINPGYGQKRERFVPMRFDPIEITDKELKIESASENSWDDFLSRHTTGTAGSNTVPPSSITTREREFHDALPIEDEVKTPNYSQMLS